MSHAYTQSCGVYVCLALHRAHVCVLLPHATASFVQRVAAPCSSRLPAAVHVAPTPTHLWAVAQGVNTATHSVMGEDAMSVSQ